MNIEKYVCDFQYELQRFIVSGEPVGVEMLKEWQHMHGILLTSMEGLRGAVQGVADVHDGMALMARLLDSAHTERLNADQVRCLIEPLRERLWVTVEDARESF